MCWRLGLIELGHLRAGGIAGRNLMKANAKSFWGRTAPCSSIDVVLVGEQQLYRKEHRGPCGVDMRLCGMKGEEHTGHGQPVEASNCFLLFGVCETASGVLCPVLSSQVRGRC